jgi:hypothetical protein
VIPALPLGVQLTTPQLMQVEVVVQAAVEVGDCWELVPVNQLALYTVELLFAVAGVEFV